MIDFSEIILLQSISCTNSIVDFAQKGTLDTRFSKKWLNKLEIGLIQLGSNIPLLFTLWALVPRLFGNESFYKLGSFVFDVFAWHFYKRTFINTYSFYFMIKPSESFKDTPFI